MDSQYTSENAKTDSSLPLSSLHLLVPPLRLVSAAMWQVVQQRDMVHYGKLEEFVTLVTDVFPELLSDRQRAQMILGLQAKIAAWLSAAPSVLEECVQSVSHLQQLKTLLQHYSSKGHSNMQENNTLSLSLQPSGLVDKTELAEPAAQSEFMHDPLLSLGHASLNSSMGAGCMGHGADHVGMEVELMTSSDISEEEKEGERGAVAGGHGRLVKDAASEMNAVEEEDRETPSETGERGDGFGDGEDKGQEKERDEQRESVETGQTLQDDSAARDRKLDLSTSCLLQQPKVVIHRLSSKDISEHLCSLPPLAVSNGSQGTGSPRRQAEKSLMEELGSPSMQKGQIIIQERKSGVFFIPLQLLPDSAENGNLLDPSSAPSAVIPGEGNTGEAVTVTALLFTCPQCQFVNANEVQLLDHMEKVHPEEYSRLVGPGGKGSGSSSLPGTVRPYTCAQCGRGFRCMSNLKKHQQTHTGARPSCCPQCGKGFRNTSDLRRHQRSHTGERPFQCTQCGKSFASSSDLTRHGRSHSEERPFCCPQCGNSFKSAANLTKHRQTHSTRRQYGCRQCGENFGSLLELSQHRQTHAVRPLHKCPQCEMYFRRRFEMGKHQLTHTDERPFQCAQCGKPFKSEKGLRAHEQTHSERPFQCSRCPRRFSQLQILVKHEQVHAGKRLYPCSKCGENFLSKEEYVNHQKTHREERPYLCSQCGKSFKKKSSLTSHQNSHSGIRPYHCSQCEKTFTVKNALIRHKFIHTGERPYLCSDCGKTFRSLTELLKHQRFHTGERPFHCSRCGKSFTQSCYLTLHLRTHTGERPYHCSYCNKSFACSTQLKRHVVIHTGEKRFQCSECGKSFNRASLLKVHQQAHMGNKI
ncbi:zinc finger protein 271-like isoform X2 [Megalops cyprinoides]|uniref:zinc finger protein 271-like isoform X2 n=1 Tax=Megalops cyprinoides TaxID=118141 RepID=UPI00186532E9|nr:zinc finger protein 271-like isoform X2 [Megalops cyprinoides]